MMNTLIEQCKEWADPFADLFGIKAILAVFGVVFSYAFGIEFYSFIGVIISLVILDTFTGIYAAKVSNTEITSRKFIKSVPKLLRYLTFIAAGHLLQQVTPLETYIENVIIIFLAATEFISITENLGKAGMPIPKKLLNRIEELRNGQ